MRSLIIAALALVASMLVTPAAQAQLTIEQIERAWGNTQPQTRSFTQHNADGSSNSGTLKIRTPGNLEFTYNNGAAARIRAGTFEFKDYGATHWETYPLGPLAAIFRRSANLRNGAVTHVGSEGPLTWIRAIDTTGNVDGYAKIYFDQQGRMVRWQRVQGNGEKIVTIIH